MQLAHTASSGEERVPAVVLDAVELHIAGLESSDRPRIFASFGASLDLAHLACRHRAHSEPPLRQNSFASTSRMTTLRYRAATSSGNHSSHATLASAMRRVSSSSESSAGRARRDPVLHESSGTRTNSGRGRPRPTMSARPVGASRPRPHPSPRSRTSPAARITAIHGDARHLHYRIVAPGASAASGPAPSTTTRSPDGRPIAHTVGRPQPLRPLLLQRVHD